MIRYADDFVVLCESEEEALRALSTIRQWCQARKLKLHPEKTRLVDMGRDGNSFEFLGFEIKRWTNRKTGQTRFLRLVRKASQNRIREAVRKVTRRTNGRSLEETIRLVNRRVNGWGRYFRSAIRNQHEALDKWIRMRLRSILRKRDKRKGRGRGRDHNRYPNAFFADRGLTSLVSIHDTWFQSLYG